MEGPKLAYKVDPDLTSVIEEKQDETMPPGKTDTRVGGTVNGSASGKNRGGERLSDLNARIDALSLHDGGRIVSSEKEEKQSLTTANDIPVLLGGWKLESEAEYAKRIGRDVKEVKEEMRRNFEELLATQAKNLPGGYQPFNVFRPPSPVRTSQDPQVETTTAEEKLEQNTSLPDVNENEVRDDSTSLDSDEDTEFEHYENILPHESRGWVSRRGRAQKPKLSAHNRHAISPLATPDSGFLADRSVSGGWAAMSDMESDETLPSLTAYIRILESCESRRRRG
ncbi:hypothetical protein GLOTRDRAFT_133251 [Gloeophyllum trabeum ATCC 11539]|uniref:Uncharacterized protein n=1 Tax=Gloeophyllum trabeum (strain ATCC 11539 / FP-39264 / Madison 617) TaxID=670483 RepID=S7RFU6_GLOTA|nr:uncharacterized protein GLOTRDRAFT_133251 [Gloeophyllum trabeum ATCC 11539]EPQ51389.1 hypothetical protein GLOTRDRAFT_133251 [Gloeophyllum trabeum ATCC 11539]